MCVHVCACLCPCPFPCVHLYVCVGGGGGGGRSRDRLQENDIFGSLLIFRHFTRHFNQAYSI